MLRIEKMSLVASPAGRVSHGVVVSVLRCGWENPSFSPPFECELGDKYCCNLSDYNLATFPWDAIGLWEGYL